MDKQINSVYSSSDYAKFKFLESNRDLNLAHVEELKESIKAHPLEKAIDVNEHFEIIDGQHRFFAWQELGMPIIYIIHKGWGADEVPVLNTRQKNWNPKDFMNMYVEMGKRDYELYKEFSERFGMTHTANLLLLHGSNKHNAEKKFQEGDLKIAKWNWANIMAKQLTEIKEYYPGYKRYGFVSAYITISYAKNFEHKTLMHKISLQPRKLVNCTTIGEYVEMLTDVFNYMTKEEKRI